MTLHCKKCGKAMKADELNTGLGPECNRYLFSLDVIEESLRKIDSYEEFSRSNRRAIIETELKLLNKTISYEEAVENVSELPGFPVEVKDILLARDESRRHSSAIALPYTYKDIKTDKDYGETLRETIGRMPLVPQLQDKNYYKNTISGRYLVDDKSRLVNGASLVWERFAMNPLNSRKFNEDLRILEIFPVGYSPTFLRRDNKQELGTVIIQSAHEAADKTKVVFLTIDSTQKKGVKLKIGFGEVSLDKKRGGMKVTPVYRPYHYNLGRGVSFGPDTPAQITTILKSYFIDNEDMSVLHPEYEADREWQKLCEEYSE